MPAVLARNGHETARPRPTRNKWGYCGGDTKGDSEAANKSDEVA
jgi:hypothetical protein